MFTSWKEFIVWETSTRDAIDVKKSYIDVADDLLAGILLSQIVYWYLPDKAGRTKLRVKKEGHYWLAKTIEEWYDEIRFSKKNYQTAIKKLEQADLLVKKVFKFNGNPTTHLRLNIPVFLAKLNALFSEQQAALKQDEFDEFNVYLMNEITSDPLSSMVLPDSVKTKCPNRAKGKSRIGQNVLPDSDISLTKNTTEKTTEKTNKESIYLKDVENLNIDVTIKNVLFQKMDRLISDQIDLNVLCTIWMAEKNSKNGLNEYQFADMLLTALSEAKEPIGSRGSISNFFKTAIKLYKQNLHSTPKETTTKPIRREKLPNWFDELDEKKIDATEKLVDPSLLKKKKAELKERLKKYRKDI